MRRAFSIVALCCAAALIASAAAIDGKWVAKFEMKAPKKQGGETRTVEITLDLKSDGTTLTGTVTGGPGRRAPTLTIENGKIEGNKFSFTTVQKGRKAETKFLWEGTLSGDELKGTRTAEGRRRGVEFTAKRAS